jgi:hypothetical protein
MSSLYFLSYSHPTKEFSLSSPPLPSLLIPSKTRKGKGKRNKKKTNKKRRGSMIYIEYTVSQSKENLSSTKARFLSMLLEYCPLIESWSIYVRQRNLILLHLFLLLWFIFVHWINIYL